MNGEDFSRVERELVLEESLQAPVAPGQQAGVLRYTLDGKTLGEIPVVTAAGVEKAGILDCLKKVWGVFCLLEETAG